MAWIIKGCVISCVVLNIIGFIIAVNTPVFIWSKTDQYFISQDHRLEGYKLAERVSMFFVISVSRYAI